ncbi:Swarming motility protein SwrC [Betaproteobacteria bacterium MOLA814]|nr:Swarming motility protein SwrC [Betaproteobacteria bacterium MOLA814]
MKFYRALLANHPLANIAFVVVVLLGAISYATMPREQDPEINFNWVNITTVLPGATAEEVERLVTNPLEDAIQGVSDIRFVTSNSRNNVSSLLVRFSELSERDFDKRMNDLRREIQNKAASEMPKEANEPRVLEITTSNGFPTAALVLKGQADDEALRLAARRIKADLERIAGVDQVFALGLRNPELRVVPDVQALAMRGLTAADVADSLQAWWRDTSAGTLRTADGAWSISVQGISSDPNVLANWPVLSSQRPGVSARLQDVARIEQARAKASQYAATEGMPAIYMSVTKKSGTNTLELVQRLKDYITQQNQGIADKGLSLLLSDDQTIPTKKAIDVMETNALLGAVMVLVVSWLFLGWKVGALIALGIPFSLLATFALLNGMNNTINVSVLLGVVIALGMLVDDAVVVAEAIYYRVQRGQHLADACVDGVSEVFGPVLASVATTMAAFLPLMLLPGIMGKFMFVIPFVVSVALAISLIEAFWMMPVHMAAIGVNQPDVNKPDWRTRFNRRIRLKYGQALAYVIRRPKRFAMVGVLSVVSAATLLATGVIRVQFFAFDPIRAFYVNIDMPSNAALEDTLKAVNQVELAVRAQLKGVGPELEARSASTLAGVKFTDTEPLYGETYGQVFVSLNPLGPNSREVEAVVEGMRKAIEDMPSAGKKSFTMLAGGPPSGKPIAVKVRGDDFTEIQAAADAIKTMVRDIPGATDVQDDNLPGRPQLTLRMDSDALRSNHVNAALLARLVRLSVDGEVVAFTREAGDKIELRVIANESDYANPSSVSALLDMPIALPNGDVTRLGALVEPQTGPTRGLIKHYNLRRTITVEANLDKDITDTAKANDMLKVGWAGIQHDHPNISLDFSGELEDIEESLNAMKVLFLLGMGLVFLILAAQFASYFQPLMILVTVPLAFTGVAFGLTLSGNPLSLYTLYGVIALTGIAVNSAIVLIAAANDRLRLGRKTSHAIVQAARRRVVPILITTTTTIGGLFSLAFGLGGKSLLWGPVASSIVWGLAFSTVLTLFMVPLLYMAFMRGQQPAKRATLRQRARQVFSRMKP